MAENNASGSVFTSRRRQVARIGGIVILMILLGVGIRWWLGDTTPPQTTPAAAPAAPTPLPPPKTEVPFLHVEGTQMAGVDPAGKKQWEIRAKSVQIDQAQKTVTFLSIAGNLYQAGKPRFAFEAPKGVLFIASRDVELSGGVSGRTAEGRSLRASHLRWDAARGKLIGSGGIILTEPGMTVTADSVIADPALQQTTFAGNIKVSVTR